MANAARFETYAIPGDRGSGQIILNGAAAHLGKAGGAAYRILPAAPLRGAQFSSSASVPVIVPALNVPLTFTSVPAAVPDDGVTAPKNALDPIGA